MCPARLGRRPVPQCLSTPEGWEEISQGCALCANPWVEMGPTTRTPEGLQELPNLAKARGCCPPAPAGAGLKNSVFFQGFAKSTHPWLISAHPSGVEEQLEPRTGAY